MSLGKSVHQYFTTFPHFLPTFVLQKFYSRLKLRSLKSGALVNMRLSPVSCALLICKVEIHTGKGKSRPESANPIQASTGKDMILREVGHCLLSLLQKSGTMFFPGREASYKRTRKLSSKGLTLLYIECEEV